MRMQQVGASAVTVVRTGVGLRQDRGFSVIERRLRRRVGHANGEGTHLGAQIAAVVNANDRPPPLARETPRDRLGIAVLT